MTRGSYTRCTARLDIPNPRVPGPVYRQCEKEAVKDRLCAKHQGWDGARWPG